MPILIHQERLPFEEPSLFVKRSKKGGVASPDGTLSRKKFTYISLNGISSPDRHRTDISQHLVKRIFYFYHWTVFNRWTSQPSGFITN